MRHNLPTELTEFVGRAGELQQILRQLQDPTCRLLTIAGLGGIGKTRLALAAAQTILDSLEVAQNNPTSHLQHPPFSDGVYFVPLAGQARLIFGYLVPNVASLTINDQTIEIAGGVNHPQMLDLPPGTYPYELQVSGHRLRSDTITVAAGETWSLRFDDDRTSDQIY